MPSTCTVLIIYTIYHFTFFHLCIFIFLFSSLLALSPPFCPFFSLPLIQKIYTKNRCGPCRLTNPIVQQISKQYSNILDVVEICTDDLPTIAESAGVVSIPTLQLYYGGRCYDTIVGCVTKTVLSSAIDKVLEDLGLQRSDDDQTNSDSNSDDDDDDDDDGDDDGNEDVI